MAIKWINQVTMKELQDQTDPQYLRHKERTRALKDPTILRCFANTVITRVPSSKFDENSTYWHQYFMLKDLKTLVRRHKMSLDEAIRYAIDEGDIHIHCDCPFWLYWGDKFYATVGDYTYGGYREHRAPTRNNVLGLNKLCFTPETPVWTKSGLVSIGELSPGDKVLDMSGSEVEVVSVIKHKKSTCAWKYWGETFISTYDHPVLVSRDRKPSQFLSVSELSTGDRIATFSGRFGKEFYSDGLMFLCGLYLGDGSISFQPRHSYGRVTHEEPYEITIAIDYRDRDWYQGYLSALGVPVACILPVTGCNTGVIHIRSSRWVKNVLSLCGANHTNRSHVTSGSCKTVRHKHLPSKWLALCERSSLWLLKGFFCADGSFTQSSGSKTCCTFYNTDLSLLWPLSVLARRFSAHCGVYSYDRVDHLLNGKVVSPKRMYAFRITARDCSLFKDFIPIKGLETRGRVGFSTKSSGEKMDFCWFKRYTKNLEDVGEREVVSIEVTGNHTYCVGVRGVVVHNCKHADKAIQYLQTHKDTVVLYFREYYNKSLVRPSNVERNEDSGEPVRDTPAEPRYVSRTTNENDTEVAYELPDEDTVYIPSEQEKEEILRESQNEAEAEETIVEEFTEESGDEPLDDSEDNSIIPDSEEPSDEGGLE